MSAGGFDIIVGETNGNWNNFKDRPGTNLTIYSCNSATDIYTHNVITGRSLAYQVSKAHPKITVKGVHGFLEYEKMWWGGYRLTGINLKEHSGLNDGYLITYQDGVELHRSAFK